jgi:hypothetical protein|eukprot:COSAG02_NODE_14339_length_1282_cov_23195.499577_1_plen_125_part_00
MLVNVTSLINGTGDVIILLLCAFISFGLFARPMFVGIIGLLVQLLVLSGVPTAVLSGLAAYRGAQRLFSVSPVLPGVLSRSSGNSLTIATTTRTEHEPLSAVLVADMAPPLARQAQCAHRSRKG